MDLSQLSEKEIRLYAQGLKQESKAWPQCLTRVPATPIECWRSKFFFVQISDIGEGLERMSVNRTVVDITNRRWRDGITWDELQEIKRQVGRGEFDAVEVFPAEKNLVNVANIRHLWIFKNETDFPFIWKSGCVK